MTFWNWRRATGAAATSGTAAMAIATDLAPIELYTADTRIVGWVAANGRRVTDLLNQEGDLRLWRPSPGPIEAPSDRPGADTDRNGVIDAADVQVLGANFGFAVNRAPVIATTPLRTHQDLEITVPFDAFLRDLENDGVFALVTGASNGAARIGPVLACTASP